MFNRAFKEACIFIKLLKKFVLFSIESMSKTVYVMFCLISLIDF